MSNSGKNLQVIYNDGSKKLIEIENLVNSELVRHGQSEIEKFKSNKEGFISLVDEQFLKLESELKIACDKSVQNFEQIVQDEYFDIKEHLENLKHQVNHLTKHLQEKLTDFKLEKQDIIQKKELTFKNEIGNVQKKKSIEIEKQGFGTIKHLRSHATNAINLLQQKLDSSLWESRSMEKNVNSTFFKTYMQKASGIETHFASLIQQLNTELQNNYKTLDNDSSLKEDDLKSVEDDYLEKISNNNDILTDDINELSEQNLKRYMKSLNKLYEEFVKEANHELKNYSEDLNDLSRNLNSEINQLNKESQESIKEKCNNLQTKIGPSKESFLVKLNNRVSSSKNIQEELQKEHDLLFSRIKVELGNIHRDSETKMENLMLTANQKLDSVTKETELEINDYQKKYSTELESIAQTVHIDIDTAVKELLEMVNSYKSESLKLIQNQTN